MPFDVGDKVVYPHHGAAVIERREKRVAFGTKQEYFVLRLAYGDLTLMVPVANAEEIGLREVINDEEVEEVFAVLRKKEARMPTNWSRRFKNHVEKLKSGDIYQVAEVVRNLTLREGDKGLSAGEKRMLARARQILVSELTFALDVDEETAESRLDEVLGRPHTPLRTELADTPTKPRPPLPLGDGAARSATKAGAKRQPPADASPTKARATKARATAATPAPAATGTAARKPSGTAAARKAPAAKRAGTAGVKAAAAANTVKAPAVAKAAGGAAKPTKTTGRKTSGRGAAVAKATKAAKAGKAAASRSG